MKVTDLMVGDWVNVNGLNLKVGAIHADEIGVFDPDYKIYWCSDDGLDHIDPIPLTEGILVKNSIKISSFTGTLYWFDEDEQCCVKPIENRFMFMYSKGADYVTFRINYVHTLQHLLRLVGIEKEIEL